MLTQPKTLSEIKHDIGIGSGFTQRIYHGWPQLDQRLRLGANVESDLQCLPLERGRDWKYHVSEFRRRVHEHVGVGVEVQR
jgi:hypothetical protein